VTIAECDRKLARIRAILDTGADPRRWRPNVVAMACPSRSLKDAADACTNVDFKSRQNLPAVAWNEEVRTIQVAANPVAYGFRGKVLNSQPWLKDGMSEQALCEVGVR
jgi:hypothetical protein